MCNFFCFHSSSNSRTSLCHFVSGSYWKHHVSSPVAMNGINSGSVRTAFWVSLQCITLSVSMCETKHAQAFFLLKCDGQQFWGCQWAPLWALQMHSHLIHNFIPLSDVCSSQEVPGIGSRSAQGLYDHHGINWTTGKHITSTHTRYHKHSLLFDTFLNHSYPTWNNLMFPLGYIVIFWCPTK